VFECYDERDAAVASFAPVPVRVPVPSAVAAVAR